MAYRVELTRAAGAELEALYLWVTSRAPSQGAAWLNGLERAVLALDQHPERCPVAPESTQSDRPIRVLRYTTPPATLSSLNSVVAVAVAATHPTAASPAPEDVPLALGDAAAVLVRMATGAGHREAGDRHRLAPTGLPALMDSDREPKSSGQSRCQFSQRLHRRRIGCVVDRWTSCALGVEQRRVIRHFTDDL